MASSSVDRAALAAVFKDPRTLRAFERVLDLTLGSAGGFPTLDTLTDAYNDIDAAAKGVEVGGFYRNSSVIQIRVS